jgi:galactonate dehydratase
MGDMRAVYESMDVNALTERALKVIEEGYRALKVVFIPYTHMLAPVRAVDHVAKLMQGLREAVGPEIEIMIDFHGRPGSTIAALDYIRALAPGRPLFVEEPVQPGSAEMMREVTAHSPVAIATGERLIGRPEFEPHIRLRAMHVAQPDICHTGGLAEARKIAAMCETAGIGIAPHNPLGPLASASALHFDIATPNFVIQEEMSGAVAWYDEVLEGPVRRENGAWQIPDRPGLGVSINEKVCAAHPFKPEVQHATNAVMPDGTVVDW